MVTANLHGKRLRIDVWIHVEMNNFYKYSMYLIKLRQITREVAVIRADGACKFTLKTNLTLISLITFEVLNQTSPNLLGSCHNTSRWCLQNYMENGWELTSEFTSKWITFKNIQSNFTLISLITFKVLNQTLSNYQGSCRNTSRWCLQIYMENGWELTSEFTST